MSRCNMLEQAATCPAGTCSNRRLNVGLEPARTGDKCPAATCSNRRLHVRLEPARTGGYMSGWNLLKQATTCPAGTCSNRRLHVRLEPARTGGYMSGWNLLEQAATCPAGTCLNRWQLAAYNMLEQAQHVRLQHHAAFCYNYPFLWSPLPFLLHCRQS
jgi:hypothetical protein